MSIACKSTAPRFLHASAARPAASAAARFSPDACHVAPDRAADSWRSFTCVIPDLRGYGFSSCPDNDPENFTYSKRAMAATCGQLMQSLGHRRFAVVGHDRGARVAYRMALDTPTASSASPYSTSSPTYDMWHNFTVTLAMKTYHWLFLAQPNPLPEMLIEPNPRRLSRLHDRKLDQGARSSPPSTRSACRISPALRNARTCACDLQRLSRRADLDLNGRRGRPCRRPQDRLPDARAVGRCRHSGDEARRRRRRSRRSAESVGRLVHEFARRGIDSGHFVTEENPDADPRAAPPFPAGIRPAVREPLDRQQSLLPERNPYCRARSHRCGTAGRISQHHISTVSGAFGRTVQGRTVQPDLQARHALERAMCCGASPPASCSPRRMRSIANSG